MGASFASLWEAIADRQGSKPALVSAAGTTSWADFEARSARVAGFLDQHGLGHGSRIGLLMHNAPEYLEAAFAAFKLRATPVNMNYRYTAREVAYLVEDAKMEAVVFHSRYAGLVADLVESSATLKAALQVPDGSPFVPGVGADYEDAISQNMPAARQERSGEDDYVIYTGGTTGFPKGVLYRVGDYARLATAVSTNHGVAPPEDEADVIRYAGEISAAEVPTRSLAASPMVHQTGMSFGGLIPLSIGATSIILARPNFDADAVWEAVDAFQVTSLTIVGDAFARPLANALARVQAAGRPYDGTSLKMIVSSGAMWSRQWKEALLEHLDVTLLDNIAATEGSMGISIASRSAGVETGRFTPSPGVIVLDDENQVIEAGSEKIGKIAIPDSVPLGYQGDEAKTAETFPVIDGRRYTIPGDAAKVLENGDIVLLGRGSLCINTSGEKVFPEEVEEVLKLHEAVVDAAVVGIPDPTYGQKVTAVVSGDADTEAVRLFARDHLAGFKVPKDIVLCEAIQRTTSGKVDYAWAREYVLAQLPGS